MSLAKKSMLVEIGQAVPEMVESCTQKSWSVKFEK